MKAPPAFSSHGPADLERIRSLFQRTRDFLETCRRNPRHAVEEEDPRALLAALEGALQGGFKALPPEEDPSAASAAEGAGGAIHRLRPRRSA